MGQTRKTRLYNANEERRSGGRRGREQTRLKGGHGRLGGMRKTLQDLSPGSASHTHLHRGGDFLEGSVCLLLLGLQQRALLGRPPLQLVHQRLGFVQLRHSGLQDTESHALIFVLQPKVQFINTLLQSDAPAPVFVRGWT